MMKRKYIFLMPLVALLLFGSCDSYLDVLPSTEKEKGEMFSTQDGYRSVLIGAYIRMKQTSLYGQEMVCGTVESLAQHWTYTEGSVGEYLHTYDYKASAVENATAAIFNNLYKVVADVNGLLAVIDNNGGVLDTKNYNIIRVRLWQSVPFAISTCCACSGLCPAVYRRAKSFPMSLL